MAAHRLVGQLDTDQEKFSMLDRAIEQDQLPYCREQGLAVLAYSPLALGLLTGRIRAEREYGRGDLRIENPRFSAQNIQRVNAMLDEFRPLAIDKGLSLGQLVIAWTLAQPGLTHALVGARNEDQAKENAGAGVALSPEEVRVMDAVLGRHGDIT
jgi:aryl-alcohol dehydrogenase-like predicted oxidoreductase